jgi:hypothetical protein
VPRIHPDGREHDGRDDVKVQAQCDRDREDDHEDRLEMMMAVMTMMTPCCAMRPYE